jgi:hypothetical protein
VASQLSDVLDFIAFLFLLLQAALYSAFSFARSFCSDRIKSAAFSSWLGGAVTPTLASSRALREAKQERADADSMPARTVNEQLLSTAKINNQINNR